MLSDTMIYQELYPSTPKVFDGQVLRFSDTGLEDPRNLKTLERFEGFLETLPNSKKNGEINRVIREFIESSKKFTAAEKILSIIVNNCCGKGYWCWISIKEMQKFMATHLEFYTPLKNSTLEYLANIGIARLLVIDQEIMGITITPEIEKYLSKIIITPS